MIEGFKILLVEDNPTDVHLVRRTLQDQNVQLICADNLEQALETLAVEEFDVVLLDLSLPDSKPEETFDAIKARSSDVPVVILTGLVDEHLASHAVLKGAKDYLIKGTVQLDQILSRTLMQAVARHEIESELRASEQRFRNIVEHASDLILRYQVRPKPGFEFVNPATLSSLGYSDKDELTEALKSGQLVHPADEERFRQALLGDSSPQRHTLRLFTREGRLRWVESSFVPSTDNHGQVVAVEAIARDVTERKSREKELAEIHNQLAESQKMEAIGQLAGGVAHDFNNLLTAIFSYGRFVLEELTDKGPIYDDVREILRAAE